MPLAVGWDQIRGTRLRVGERRPTIIGWNTQYGGPALASSLVPPYESIPDIICEMDHIVSRFFAGSASVERSHGRKEDAFSVASVHPRVRIAPRRTCTIQTPPEPAAGFSGQLWPFLWGSRAARPNCAVWVRTDFFRTIVCLKIGNLRHAVQEKQKSIENPEHAKDSPCPLGEGPRVRDSPSPVTMGTWCPGRGAGGEGDGLLSPVLGRGGPGVRAAVSPRLYSGEGPGVRATASSRLYSGEGPGVRATVSPCLYSGDGPGVRALGVIVGTVLPLPFSRSLLPALGHTGRAQASFRLVAVDETMAWG